MASDEGKLAAMPDRVFPDRPVARIIEPVHVAYVVPRSPLDAIRELLSISIHDVVNETGCKCVVEDLYRITRRVDNEAWLRGQIWQQEYDDWVAGHL